MRHGVMGLRSVVTALAFVVLAPTALVVIGGYLPWLPVVGRFGGLIGPALPGIVLGAAAAAVLGVMAVRLGGAAFNRALATTAIAVLAGTILIVGQILTFAGGVGAALDPVRAALPAAATRTGAGPTPDRRLTFPTTDGSELDAQVWDAAPSSGGASAADGDATASGRTGIVFVHGGGFVTGGLGSRPDFFRFLADAGHPVVDVAYRLAPPPRWDQAGWDVLCALTWVGEHGADLGIDPTRIVLIGDSSGGNLALIAAFTPRPAAGAGPGGSGTGGVPGGDGSGGSCAERAPVPIGVVGIAPAADLAGIWQDDTIIAAGGRFPDAYVGGSPAEFPDRYAAASPLSLIRAGLPPTLLITGANDQLVRPERTRALAGLLAAAGVPCRLLVVPFADHGFDAPPNAFGAQLEESVLPAFIRAVAGGSDLPASWGGC